MDFKNESGLAFTNIGSEKFREYHFGTVVVRIDKPLFLHVSDSGGHRVFDGQGISHYIPAGWIHLLWEASDGQPNFVK